MSYRTFFVFRTQHVTCSKNYNTTTSCSNTLKLGKSTEMTHEDIPLQFEIISASLWSVTCWRSAEVSFRSSPTTRIFTNTQRTLDTQRDMEAITQSHEYHEFKMLHITHVSSSAWHGRCTYGKRDVIRPTAKLHSPLHAGGNKL